MAARPKLDVPLYLRRAHDEVLLALFSETNADEAVHRERAGVYVSEAVRTIRDDPMREYDWSALTSHA
ncbi:MAG: hypothetical protein ABIT04_05440 [Novosphingobium sp.]